MTTLIPAASSSQPAGVEAYEDMFKEITRKLYGDESAHGLYPHNTQVAQVAQLAPGAPAAAPEGGERSFTTLVSDRNIGTTIDYETTTVNEQQQQGGGQRSEEHLTTAFGLAALMQNGFPPPGAILNPVNFPAKANIVSAVSDDRWQQNQQQEPPAGEQSWNSGGKHGSSSSYSHKSFKKPKVEPQDGSPTGTNNSTLNIPQSDKKGNYSAASASATVGAATGKRYACTSCPYTTDRRDLFTRHENIHKEEKPFHCYACLKQFNRADHVKKHFMRMHRDMEYEIAKTRRVTASVTSSTNTPTHNAKPYYNSSSSSSNTPVSAPPPPTTVVSPPVTVIPVVSTLNIPTANFPAQLSIPSSHHPTTTATTIESVNIVTLNGATTSALLHQHHQNQQQQQQHQSAPQIQQQQHQIVVSAAQPLPQPPIVTIKQEKGVVARDGGGAGAGNSSNGSSNHLVDDKFAKKIKGEKRFTCCYCPWSGADNWGLKRHLNTHTKPYVCVLCDYKAARSERLATHVFKVHNKKACSKCTFFAEDQDQLNAHMQDSHLLNMQALGRNKASVTQDFHNAGGGTHRQLYHSDSNSSSNGGHDASSSPSPSPPPSSAASSRSPSRSPPAKAAATTIAPSAVAPNLSEEHLSLLQLLATAAVAQQHMQLQQHQQQQKATSILGSPPASHPPPPPTSHHQNSTNQNQTEKRRRKSSSRNDKENLGQKQRTATLAVGGKVIDLTVSAAASGPTPDGIERNNNSNSSSNNNNSSVNNKNINETIFDKVMYKKPPSYQNLFLTSAFCKPVLGPAAATEKDPRKEDRVIVAEKSFSLAEFLRNHTEVSISTLNSTQQAVKSTNADDDVVFIKEEKRRKQQAPRKVDQPPTTTEPPSVPTNVPANVGDIRDKHMIRLITRRLCCRICQNQNLLASADNCHYHSKTSLILHNRWRHGRDQTGLKRCCGQSFLRRYKLALHQKLVHRRRCDAGDKRPPAKATAAKKQTRKQRKRKPRSRCFTKRRK